MEKYLRYEHACYQTIRIFKGALKRELCYSFERLRFWKTHDPTNQQKMVRVINIWKGQTEGKLHRCLMQWRDKTKKQQIALNSVRNLVAILALKQKTMVEKAFLKLQLAGISSIIQQGPTSSSLMNRNQSDTLESNSRQQSAMMRGFILILERVFKVNKNRNLFNTFYALKGNWRNSLQMEVGAQEDEVRAKEDVEYLENENYQPGLSHLKVDENPNLMHEGEVIEIKISPKREEYSRSSLQYTNTEEGITGDLQLSNAVKRFSEADDLKQRTQISETRNEKGQLGEECEARIKYHDELGQLSQYAQINEQGKPEHEYFQGAAANERNPIQKIHSPEGLHHEPVRSSLQNFDHLSQLESGRPFTMVKDETTSKEENNRNVPKNVSADQIEEKMGPINEIYGNMSSELNSRNNDFTTIQGRIVPNKIESLDGRSRERNIDQGEVHSGVGHGQNDQASEKVSTEDHQKKHQAENYSNEKGPLEYLEGNENMVFSLKAQEEKERITNGKEQSGRESMNRNADFQSHNPSKTSTDSKVNSIHISRQGSQIEDLRGVEKGVLERRASVGEHIVQVENDSLKNPASLKAEGRLEESGEKYEKTYGNLDNESQQRTLPTARQNDLTDIPTTRRNEEFDRLLKDSSTKIIQSQQELLSTQPQRSEELERTRSVLQETKQRPLPASDENFLKSEVFPEETQDKQHRTVESSQPEKSHHSTESYTTMKPKNGISNEIRNANINQKKSLSLITLIMKLCSRDSAWAFK